MQTIVEHPRMYRTYGTVSSQTAFTFSIENNGMNMVIQFGKCSGTGTGVEGGTANVTGFESGGGTSGGLSNRDRIAWYGHKGTSGGTSSGDDRIAGYWLDTNSWYNIVIRTDTSQTSGNRIKYYEMVK